MKRIIQSTLVLLLCICLMPSAAVDAQDCPSIVLEALDATDQNCAVTVRNSLCYGNGWLDAIPQTGVASFAFSFPGDEVEVSQVQTLRVGAMDEIAGTWGVALMNIQASLPDTLPGQNVTILLFGDVQLENAVRPLVLGQPAYIHTTEGDSMNIRTGPSLNDSVLVTLANGTQVTVVDGPVDNGGYRFWEIRLANGATGWVVEDVDDNNERLPTLVRDPGMFYGPMQAFYFSSGIGDAACATAPDSGILIQTPEGASELTVSANEVTIELGSTVYMQAQAQDNMVISVLEGQARVSALGQTQTALSGTQIQVGMNANLRPTQVPTAPQPFDPALLTTLPVNLLPRPIMPDTGTSLDVTGKIWQFERSDGTIIAPQIILLPDGSISGHTDPNEVRWGLEDSGQTLVFYNSHGITSTRFTSAQLEQGRLVLTGQSQFSTTAVSTYILRELPPILDTQAPTNLAPVLGTGDVQVTLTWDNNSDLDLYVTEPNGNVISHTNRYSDTNGQLDVDSNYPCGQNLHSVENVYWPTGYAPSGPYYVSINEWSRCDESVAANWTLVVRVDGRIVLELTGSGDSRQFAFKR